MKRLYYLADNIDSVANVAADLYRKGITGWNFHVMSRNRQTLKYHRIHTSNSFLHDRDSVRLAERGALIGVVAGICLTLSLIMLTPVLEVHLLAITLVVITCLATYLLMGTLGAMLGGIYGSKFENNKIRKFHDDLVDGKFLIMADVTKENVEQVKNVMQVLHTDALAAGEDDIIITPFQAAA